MVSHHSLDRIQGFVGVLFLTPIERKQMFEFLLSLFIWLSLILGLVVVITIWIAIILVLFDELFGIFGDIDDEENLEPFSKDFP